MSSEGKFLMSLSTANVIRTLVVLVMGRLTSLSDAFLRLEG